MESKLHKCPYCKAYFRPRRSNQLYCNNKHAYTFRNHIGKRKNRTLLEHIRLQLNNLKLLTTLEINDSTILSPQELEEMGFDWKGTLDVPNPLLKDNPNSKSKWAEVYGFLIRKSDRSNSPVWFFSPSMSVLLLTKFPD